MSADQLFDAFLAADEKRQIGLALGQAKRDLECSKRRTCEKCFWWMKSQDCPQEKNVKGYSRGPASGSRLAQNCGKFQRSPQADETTRGIELKIEEIAAATCFSDLPPKTHY